VTCWVNIDQPDVEAAIEFYGGLFGWTYDDATPPEGFEDVIGGLAPTEPGEAPHWHITFSVADRDESVASVERLGGTVLHTREDDWTRNALVSDPARARFTVSQIAPPTEWD